MVIDTKITVPVIYALKGEVRQVRGINPVAGCEPRRYSASRMRSNGVAPLSFSEIKRDCENRLGGNDEIDGIRNYKTSIRDNNRGASAESKSLKGFHLDGAASSRVVNRKRDGCCGNGETGCAKSVRDANSNLRTTNRRVEGLTNGHVCENRVGYVLERSRSV